MSYLVIAAGVYLTGLALMMNCPDMASRVIMKVIPGLIGIGLLIAGGNMLGVL